MGLEPAVGNVGEKKKENEKKSTDPRKIKGKKRTAASRRRTNERTTTTTKWRRVAMTTQSALSLAYYSVPVAPFFFPAFRSVSFSFLPVFLFYFRFFFVFFYCFLLLLYMLFRSVTRRRQNDRLLEIRSVNREHLSKNWGKIDSKSFKNAQ